jgi:hypothetical protein
MLSTSRWFPADQVSAIHQQRLQVRRNDTIVDNTHRGNDDGDNFAALDFGDESSYDSGAALDFGDESEHGSSAVLDFGDESGYDTGEQWGIDQLPTDEPVEFAHSATEQHAIDTLPEDTGDTDDTDAEDDEFAWELTTVTNPVETVSVTAMMDGTIHHVELSAGAASMTESELADEVLVIANLAAQRASSVLHRLLLEGVQAQGLDGDGNFADLLGTRFLDLTSPEQADRAQAEVFATRYGSGDR